MGIKVKYAGDALDGLLGNHEEEEPVLDDEREEINGDGKGEHAEAISAKKSKSGTISINGSDYDINFDL